MPTGTAIVTGGSGGIGSAACRSLVELGFSVINLDLATPPDTQPGVRHIAVDLSDAEATRAAGHELAATNEVQVLVHNVGVIRPALLEAVDASDFDYLHALHLRSALLLMQSFGPSLRRATHGRVVLISSRAALGLPTRTSYSATKAALLGLTRTWALELAGDGTTVNAIAPGPIAGTGMFHEQIPEDSPQMNTLAASIPVGRLGRAEDVAHALEYFVSPRASFVTGQVLYVCGGASVGTLSL